MMFSISNPLTAIVATYYTDELIMYCNNTKLEAEGVTYGEVKYTGGEASIIKINNWGTIEKTTITRHRKAYAMTYIGKRSSDIELTLFVEGVNGATVVTVK
ncbi:hypothetical protein [Prevotella pallens]